MVGKPTLPNWLVYIRPHIKPYLALGRGERRKYIEKLSKQTKLSDNSLRRYIAAAQFLEAEGITDLPPGGRLPLGAVENIARIAAHDPSRRRILLDKVAAGNMTIDEVAAELETTRKSAKRRRNTSFVGLEDLVIEELKERQVDLKGLSILSFDDDGDARYFDSQTKPSLVIRLPGKPPMVAMDGRKVGGTAASFMRQRKEFLRNVLVAAGLYETVLVYAPHWQEDVARLIGHARSAVGVRILLIESSERPEEYAHSSSGS
ncbi:hypothetical protein JQ596_17075 [Bradyrhizobium manausense]|uniref:hypothetical protein n=1 Tax=Bradyrhizobium TaxID=374 RepID=UPI001BA5DF56|nr:MULTISPECIES: hypothetical protein [Bradyrhizobium]MBR0827240.1 hypothetical protein [Bradyrhizobium manausense]UVO27136.1 hypothetical protein KUF59_32165 [Bradyrhizobium arachidis]